LIQEKIERRNPIGRTHPATPLSEESTLIKQQAKFFKGCDIGEVVAVVLRLQFCGVREALETFRSSRQRPFVPQGTGYEPGASA
jgi:hypothetical protein